MVGRCIGKGGETIKRLQTQSGANIQVDQVNSQPIRRMLVTPILTDCLWVLAEEHGRARTEISPDLRHGMAGRYGDDTCQ